LVAIDGWPVSARLSPTRYPGLAISLLAGVAAFPVGLTALGLPLPDRRGLPLLTSPALLVSALLLSPLFEEYVFRVRLLDSLRARFGDGLAVAVSAILFAALHLSPSLVAGSFVSGLVLGSLRIATGCVLPCVAFHVGLNLSSALGLFSFAPIPHGTIVLLAVELSWLVLAAHRTIRVE
jgi:membrane protease YdiL (CAAX protease family)